ncbi:MAG: hypothetical protein K8F26_01180 [Thiobacillus sp.]|nr:hypothetical protein [Thiobacillus sp.]
MSVTFFKNAIALLKRLKRDPVDARFIKHNKRAFACDARQQDEGPIVMMELSSMQSAHIAYSYLANVLATENNARIIGYVPRVYSSRWKRLAFKIAKLLGLSYLGVYRSFGATDFLTIEISEAQIQKARRIYDEVTSQFGDKWDIEALTIHGIWVGDLIYDTYLARFNKPTVDKTNPEFQRFLLESIELFVFWEDYLDSHDVRAINVSHCVYNVAMPLRLGVERNIPVFQTNVTHVYRMSKKNYFAYNDFFYFRERFAALPEEVKTAGIAEAKRRIERRFAGEVGVDMAYSTKSAYGTSRHVRLLRESPRKKILIATHCFFDSPHSYGNNVFPDFYEWLDFLGKLSEVTDYDWYIKTHPDYLPGTMEIIEAFIAKYPKFTLLPSDASHHQIIAEGINVALTVYGTIAFEYAALGIPVINNSLNNPHIAYDFNLHSRDVEDYRRLLLGLDTLDFKIDKQQVYEYYFMRFMYNTEDLFFDSYDTTIEELGGYSAQFTPAVYGKWLEEWSPDKHRSIVTALQTYIRSGDFRMDYRHYGREFGVESIGEKP